MLRVEIDIPRPLETASLLLIVAGVVLGIGWGSSADSQHVRAGLAPMEQSSDGGAGGADRAGRILALSEAENDARRIRMEQAVLSRKEEILRYELKFLEAQTDGNAIRAAREELLRLLSDERAAEQRFLETLKEMWEAEGLSASAAIGSPGIVEVLWPVEPELGLSATFLDPAYEQRFGIPHHAIDIPVEQGSAVRSAADGVVEKVVDNGLGYSYILIKHSSTSSGQGSGFATLYGHMSESLVQEGSAVRQGDAIARSGGMPGTPGAGAISTGPHVHFEVIERGERVDPLTVLPSRPGLLEPSA